MAHLYCNGGNRFNFVNIRNYTQNNFGGGYSYGCSMPSFGGIFSNWGTGIYTGYPCNGGWSWSAFAGNTFGSLVGNVLGMLFWGGNNGLYSGIGYTSGSTQGQRTTGNNGNGKDTDFAQIDFVHKNIIEPDDNYVKNLLEKCELDACEKQVLKQYFKGKLENLGALEKGLDGVNDTENKTYIDNLKKHINRLASSKGIDLTDDTTPNTEVKIEKKSIKKSATPVAAEAPEEKDAGTKIVSNVDSGEEPQIKTFEKEHNLTRSLTEPNTKWNTYDESMIPSGWALPDDYTQPKAEYINDNSIIKVEDTSKETDDIPVNTCKVSPAGKDTNGFPATLEITSKNGKHWYYHYAGESGGCPVYITPKTDTNHNVYVLCKKGNDYKLMQFEKFSGCGNGDYQNNN